MAFLGRGTGGDPPIPQRLATHFPELHRISWLEQIHSATVAGPDLAAVPNCGPVGRGDALVGDEGGRALVVVTADCVPVLVATPKAKGREIGAIHAGWRGLVAGVIPQAVESLKRVPEVAWIGPAIGPCCYEVDDDVANQVARASSPSIRQPGPAGKPHLDLVAAAAQQLETLGVEDIRRVGGCTRCDPGWWSYRRDGAAAGRNLAVIWKAEEPGQ